MLFLIREFRGGEEVINYLVIEVCRRFPGSSKIVAHTSI